MLDPRAEQIQIDLSIHARPSCKSMYVQNYKKRSFKKLWLQVFQRKKTGHGQIALRPNRSHLQKILPFLVVWSSLQNIAFEEW